MEKVDDRLFVWGSNIDNSTVLQAQRTSRLPIIHDHVSLMPDAHIGAGATIGSVIPTENAIIPSAVGVDIGCGMIAARTNRYSKDLPDSLEPLLLEIEQTIPAGVGNAHLSGDSTSLALLSNKPGTQLDNKTKELAACQLGTLGSGNHFVEVSLDEDDRVWIVLHSGSRKIGNLLAQQHIDVAKNLARELHLGLEDPELAWFTQGTPEFEAYITDMLWAQDYAMLNRELMMKSVTKTLFKHLPPKSQIMETINCHHNFAKQEAHQGRELWITRKGAIRAMTGDRGVIPGSMGTKSYIVTGLGNEDSWMSSSHGAGRRMSRGDARRTFSDEDLRKAMIGKTWLDEKAERLVDESPASYKDIDAVMADQADLVRIAHTLTQVLNYKGA
jgi:tRNA-splicing ligase RtcB